MVLTFGVPLLSARIRHHPALLLACWAVLGLHQAAALTNCFIATIPMGEEDARTFHLVAQGLRPQETYHPYASCLHAVYHYLGCSHLLGCELSVLAFALSLLVFVELVERHRVPLVLLFGSLPALVCATSVTLRESFQVLLVLTATLMLTRGRALPALLALALLAKLHNGLALFALALAGLALWRRPALALVLALLLAAFPGYLVSSSPATSSLFQGTLLREASTYRQGVPRSSKTYHAPLDTSSLGGFAATFPPVLGLYLFAPLPGAWHFYATAESCVRLVLCSGILLAPRRWLPLLIFLALESLWAVGTSNWGQAIRHRTVGYGLLVALGATPWLDLMLRRRFSRL